MAYTRPGWQRAIAICACLVFLCCFYGSLSVQAVFGIDDIIIGGVTEVVFETAVNLLLLGLAGSGLDGEVKDAAASANTPVLDWLSGKAQQFIASLDGNFTPIGFARAIANSVAYNSDGTLIFGDFAGSMVDQFARWLDGEGDIAISSGGVSSGVINTSIGNVYQLKAGEMYTDSSTSNTIVSTVDILMWRSSTGSYYLCGQSTTAGNFTVSYNGSTQTYSLSLFNGYYIVNIQWVGNFYTGLPAIPYSAPQAIDFSSTGATSGLDVWNEDAPDGWVLDPTGLIGDAVAGLQGAIANVGDYIGTLADVIAGVANPALPIPGIGDIAIDIPADITIPVDVALPEDVVTDEPIAGTDEATPYPGTGDYTLALADFFPFCIPFDIYKMLSLLAADPVAPSFTWQFYTPGGGTIPIDVDLSGFNTVAAVLRAVETLAFCVGLGFVTKKLLFGS